MLIEESTNKWWPKCQRQKLAPNKCSFLQKQQTKMQGKAKWKCIYSQWQREQVALYTTSRKHLYTCNKHLEETLEILDLRFLDHFLFVQSRTLSLIKRTPKPHSQILEMMQCIKICYRVQEVLSRILQPLRAKKCQNLLKRNRDGCFKGFPKTNKNSKDLDYEYTQIWGIMESYLFIAMISIAQMFSN